MQMPSWHEIPGYCLIAGSICCGYVLIKQYVKEKYDKEIEKFKNQNAQIAQANAAAQVSKLASEDPLPDLVTEGYDEPRSYYGYSSSTEYN